MEQEIKTPKVTLMTWTKLPLETVYAVWEASKGEGKLIAPEDVQHIATPEEVEKLFRAVIAQRIPIGEHIDFVFMLENISISWREQAVRHRIGTKASPERLGADMVVDVIPDLADSSWWSQSMRIQDMGKFADNRAYRIPETLLARSSPHLLRQYEHVMAHIQHVYNELVKAGVPMEDARELMPLGAQHRMSWRLNIGSLQHIFGKRGCWILQLGIWGPIITGMVEELATKVHPIFRELISPPCVKGDTYTGCVFQEESRRRYTGDDQLPPCSLHLRQEWLPQMAGELGGNAGMDQAMVNEEELRELGVPRAGEMLVRAEEYRKFWGRDPFNGKRLRVIP